MDRIMVDNWFLREVAHYRQDPAGQDPKPYAELLMALVLWDEVCFPKNERSAVWAGSGELADCLTPIDDTGETLGPGAAELLIGIMEEDGLPDPYFLWLSDPEQIVNASALRYLMLSAKHGCDYLPAPRRQVFLQEHRAPKYMKGILTRMQLQNYLDEAAAVYYKETYEALLDFSSLELSMPVLADYVVRTAPAELSPLQYALHLQQEGPVVRYRSYLRRVEEALEQQQWKELRRLLAASKEAVDEVIALDQKRLSGVTVKLLPAPALTANYRGVRTELSASPALSLELNPRRMHLSFLRDLTDYAINERKLL